MKYKDDASIVYNTIKKQSGLNDEALALLNITKEYLAASIDQCVSKGMSRKKAQRTLIQLWNSSKPEGSATPKEMGLMGFERIDGGWKHQSGLTLNDEFVARATFQEVEAMAIESMQTTTPQQSQTETEFNSDTVRSETNNISNGEGGSDL